jgi:hypothetical protein
MEDDEARNDERARCYPDRRQGKSAATNDGFFHRGGLLSRMNRHQLRPDIGRHLRVAAAAM